jgi:hypothetical protein
MPVEVPVPRKVKVRKASSLSEINVAARLRSCRCFGGIQIGKVGILPPRPRRFGNCKRLAQRGDGKLRGNGGMAIDSCAALA